MTIVFCDGRRFGSDWVGIADLLNSFIDASFGTIRTTRELQAWLGCDGAKSRDYSGKSYDDEALKVSRAMWQGIQASLGGRNRRPAFP